jgi:hypothetical protein
MPKKRKRTSSPARKNKRGPKNEDGITKISKSFKISFDNLNKFKSLKAKYGCSNDIFTVLLDLEANNGNQLASLASSSILNNSSDPNKSSSIPPSNLTMSNSTSATNPNNDDIIFTDVVSNNNFEWLKTFPFRHQLNKVCTNIRLKNPNDVMSILMGIPVDSRLTSKSRVVFDESGQIEYKRQEEIKYLFSSLITCYGGTMGSNESNDLFVYWLLHTNNGRDTFKYVVKALNASEKGVNLIFLQIILLLLSTLFYFYLFIRVLCLLIRSNKAWTYIVRLTLSHMLSY